MKSNLEVCSVQGLSIVNASVMPSVHASHTCSTVCAAAEKVRSTMYSTILRAKALLTVNLIKVLKKAHAF